MKQINKIKLHQLSSAELADKEQKLLKGGTNRCGCASVCPEETTCQCEEDPGGGFTEALVNTDAASGGLDSYVNHEYTIHFNAAGIEM